jgi:prepilin-type processing-associated H-X9-DG protein
VVGVAPNLSAPAAQPMDAHEQRAGWMFQILPFVEQDNIYKGSGQPTIGGEMSMARAQVIKSFFCPSRRGPTAYSQATSWYLPTSGYPGCGTHAQTDYAGSIANNSNDNGVIVRTFNHNMGDSIPGTKRRDPARLMDISDGLSNTLVAGDKWRLLTANGFQGDDNEGYSAGWDHDTVRRTSLAPRPDSGPVQIDGLFGGRHPNGFNGLLADGSVRFVSFAISCCGSGSTFWRLGHKSDGGVLGSDW